MKFVIAVVIIAVVALGGWQLYEYWQTVEKEEQKPIQRVEVPATQLEGMDYSLEAPLEEAKKRGADGLRDFLRRYKSKIKDPRLASIQLDYVSLVAKDNPAEARRVFAEVKERTSPSSPIYPRVQQLEKTFGT